MEAHGRCNFTLEFTTGARCVPAAWKQHGMAAGKHSETAPAWFQGAHLLAHAAACNVNLYARCNLPLWV